MTIRNGDRFYSDCDGKEVRCTVISATDASVTYLYDDPYAPDPGVTCSQPRAAFEKYFKPLATLN